MARLLFKLRYVPDDEAQEVRELLRENEIDFYETTAGILGISMPGLWLKNEEQAEKARSIIDEYQQQLQSKMQEEYQLNSRSSMDMFRENPVRYIGYLLAITLICYYIVYLFFNLF